MGDWWKSDAIAYYESQAASGPTAFAAVADGRYSSSGDRLTIRSKPDPKLLVAIPSGPNVQRAQLRENPAFEGTVVELPLMRTQAAIQVVNDLWANPIPLAPGGVLEAFMDNSNNAEVGSFVGSVHYGPLQPAPDMRAPSKFRRVFSIRTSHGSITTTGAWAANTTTPAGLNPNRDYCLLAAYPYGDTGIIAARINAANHPLNPEISDYKPLVPAIAQATLRNVEEILRSPFNAWGKDGIWFRGNNPPTFDFLLSATTTPIMQLVVGEVEGTAQG